MLHKIDWGQQKAEFKIKRVSKQRQCHPQAHATTLNYAGSLVQSSPQCQTYRARLWEFVPRHALPHWDYIHSISEVIILDNDQHQHQKTISANIRFNSKINQNLIPFVGWCCFGREFLFEKVCVWCLQVRLGQQIRGIE